MRPPLRVCATAAAFALALAGCGGEDEDGAAAGTTSAAATTAPVGANGGAEEVVACLKARGVAAKGPFPAMPDDDDAPDRGEVILPGAMLAFYSSAALAEKRARTELPKDGSTQNGLTIRVIRRGPVSALIFDPVNREAIEACLPA